MKLKKFLSLVYNANPKGELLSMKDQLVNGPDLSSSDMLTDQVGDGGHHYEFHESDFSY